MTPREYLDLFRERWRSVVAGLLLGVLVAAAVVWSSTPVYSAHTTLFVTAGTSTDASSALDRNQLSVQRMQTYVELVTSDKIAGEVVESLGLDSTGEELASRISASSEPDTVLLGVSVTDPDPERAAEIANVLADRFIANVGELELAGGLPGAAIVTATVFEEAEPPTSPVAPRPALTLALGAALGLLAGIALAVLRRALGTSVADRRALSRVVESPVLGVIAKHRDPAELVVRDDPRGAVAEAYRRLRTNLQFVDVDRVHKIVLLASPSSGDGTTTVVCNLACALAEAGQRVLVIEADLRRPLAADRFGLARTVGLTSVLARRADLADVVQHGWGGVDVITSGPIPPNPAQLLASPQMVQLLADVRPRYDVVLVDAPPVLPVADATVLAPLVDGALLVVRAGTPAPRVEAAAESLTAVSSRLLGTVLTKVKGRAGRGDERYAAGSVPAADGGFPSPARSSNGGVPAAPPAAAKAAPPPVPAQPADLTAQPADTMPAGQLDRPEPHRPTPFPRSSVSEGSTTG